MYRIRYSMPRKLFKQFLPDPARIKKIRMLGVLGGAIHNSELWHLTKCSVAGAFFIGVFCAFLPIPFQTVLAGLLAMLFKRNLPLAVILVFITNPFTMAPIFYGNYWVGSLILGHSVDHQTVQTNNLGQWFTTHFDSIGAPLLLGSVICGLAFGLFSYIAVHQFWIWRVRQNWRSRRTKRTIPNSK